MTDDITDDTLTKMRRMITRMDGLEANSSGRSLSVGSAYTQQTDYVPSCSTFANNRITIIITIIIIIITKWSKLPLTLERCQTTGTVTSQFESTDGLIIQESSSSFLWWIAGSLDYLGIIIRIMMNLQMVWLFRNPHHLYHRCINIIFISRFWAIFFVIKLSGFHILVVLVTWKFQ